MIILFFYIYNRLFTQKNKEILLRPIQFFILGVLSKKVTQLTTKKWSREQQRRS